MKNILVIVFTLLACNPKGISSEQTIDEFEENVDSISSISIDSSATKSDTLDAEKEVTSDLPEHHKLVDTEICQLVKNIENREVLRYLLDSARTISRTADDSCMIALLDALTHSYILTSEDKYISALEAFCLISDGYMGEYFWGTSERIFRQQFGGYIDFLYRNKDACLRIVFTESLGVEIGMAKDRGKKRNEIFNFMNSRERELNLDADVVEFIEKLKGEINESILD